MVPWRAAWRDAWGGKLGDDDGTMAHILLAEDDDSMREFLAKALRRAGYEVMPTCGHHDRRGFCLGHADRIIGM
ncbi:MAG: hypothetical protein IH993_08240 [Proteobacteria bacterium]|nr:hypothetical protein [Pseudomonadota bacterium]